MYHEMYDAGGRGRALRVNRGRRLEAEGRSIMMDVMCVVYVALTRANSLIRKRFC